MNELVCIGKSVSTFGIKGELKVISDFEYHDKAFKVGNTVLINNQEYKISSIRYHKNYILMSINNLDNINLILDKVGYNIYLAKSDLNLSEDEYLLHDLIGATVCDDDNTSLGVIEEVLNGGHNNLIRVAKKEESFLIPMVDEYIIKFDQDKKILYTKNARSLII